MVSSSIPTSSKRASKPSLSSPTTSSTSTPRTNSPSLPPIFYETPQKSSTTWSSVVSSFAQNELLVLAVGYFCRMLGAQLRPDDHIYPSVAKSCAILNRFDVGKSVHCPAVKTGYEFDVFVGSSVVDVHVKCGEIRDAQKVFDENPKKNVVSWRWMIYGYAQLGQDEEAMRQFKPIP